LVVDQFERLFTDLHDDDARRRFIETLVAVAGEDVKVLVTLRADFYGTALENPGVARALDRGQLTLLRMSDTELLRAITAPAHNENRSFEPGLPERLAADVTGHPGDLPLVEFTLTELWQRDGDTGVLTAATYDELGSVGLSGERFPGVQGAIARRADEVWRELDPDERAAARRVFLSLVAAGPVDERGQQIASDASRRAWQQVEWDDATRAVAAKLVDARLLTTGQDPFSKEPTVEVAHEALIRAWPQLQQWVATQPEFVRWYDHDLAPSLRRWWEHEKHPEFLLPGVMLPPAEHWLGENPEGLSGRPAEYIRASVEAWRQEQQRLEHERRRLERALAEAERQHAIVQARELAARAELTRTAGLRLLERSVLLTVESLRRVPTFEGDQALRGGLALLRRRSALVPADGDVTGYTFRAFSRDGRRLVISRGDGSVLVSEAASGSEIRRLGPEHQLSGVALSADGRRLAANGPGGAIHVIDVASGAEVNRISGKDARGAAGALALDADGRRVARAWADGSADVWEVASRARLASVRGEHEAVLRGVAFGPREGLLLTRGDNEPARVWDLSTERELAALAHERGSTTAVACSPTGAFVATGGTDWAVRVWETDAWSQVVRFAHELELRDLAFSGDGRLLASASADGMTLVWRVDGWREEARLRHLDVGNVAFASGTMLVTVGLDGGRAVWELGTGRSPAVFVHEGPVHGVAFSADGSLLASAGGDNMARIWELESGRELPCLGHDEAVVAVAFSHDAARVATVSWDQTARVWDLVTARELTRASHGGWPSSTVAFSPDGGRIAGASLRAALVWDAWSGTELARLDHERGTVFGVDFSPDGALLAAADSNEGVLIWRLRTQAPPARLGHPWGLTDVAFSRDGSLLATASGSTGDARVWEVASGKERLRVAHERPWATAVSFSADGERLATGGRDGTARVWDVATSDELVRIGHAGAVNDVALSPDGAWLATACEDGAARVFPLRPEDLIGEACRRLSRNLTEEEWRQYLGGEPYRKTCPELP
jgi:WD40 repeat protein